MPTQASPAATPAAGHLLGTTTEARIRRVVLVLLALVPVLLHALHGGDRSAYLECGVVNLLSAGFCLMAASTFRSEQVRWVTLAVAQALHSLAYFAPPLRDLHLLSYAQAAWIGNFGIAVCWTLFVPALMGMGTGRGLMVRWLDIALIAFSSLLLMFALGSGTLVGDSTTRVVTTVLVLTTLTLLALFTRFVQASAGLRQFTRTALLFLLASVAIAVLANVVLMRLAHLPDVLANTLAPLPALLLCDLAPQRDSPPAWSRLRLNRALIDSMQPSVLTLGSMVLALFAFRGHPMLAASYAVGIVLCYTVRTQAFYSRLFHERSRLRSEANQLQRLATHDALTGIGNRRWFESNIHRWLAETDAYPCTLLLADIDRFKQVNDVHGHSVGDQVLCMVADVLQHATGPVRRTCIARLGGDEFAALLATQDTTEAASTAERIRSAVEALGNARGLGITVSIGAATAFRPATRSELLQSADEALYQVKAAGRNGVACQALRTEHVDEPRHFLHEPEPSMQPSSPLA